MINSVVTEARIGDRDGWRVANAAAEAFVIARPYPRVVSFRLANGESPLRTSVADPFFGVRTWFLEPTQTEMSPLPALQPAEAEAQPDGSLRLVAAVDPTARLQIVQEIALDPVHPVLRIRHRLVNHDARLRRLAAWAISVVPHAGVGVTPWAAAAETIRALLSWPGMNPGDPAIRLGAHALGVDFRLSPACGWLKVGTNTDAGWVAYIWPGGALRSRVPYEEGREYPEGDGSVTLYSSGRTPDEGFCEIENVGPLTNVPSGEAVELIQTLELLPCPGPTGDNPDDWLASVEATPQCEPENLQP